MQPIALPGGEGVPPRARAWDAGAWLDAFGRATARRDHGALRSLQAAVFRTTVAAVRRRGYVAGGRAVALDADRHYEALRRGTRFYPSTDDLAVPPARRDAFPTRVRVVNADCLEVARSLAASGAPPAVLNMASPDRPGGSVLAGAGAQEESLFRRTNLLWSLFQFVPDGADYGVPPCPTGARYPIPRESAGIYTPPAAVFRAPQADGYAFLDAPFRAAFVTVPAIPRPAVVHRRDALPWLTAPMARATRRKIRAILRIAAAHGHADLVLSAFGCGAFRNPPHHVAQLFREVLSERELRGVFREIVFAVIDDHNAARPSSPEGNFAPFARELAGLHAAR
jgi:uncharacterized protein (TIGR02452 family)